MRSTLVLAFVILFAACAGATGGAVATVGTAADPKLVAYHAKSGDVEPTGHYRMEFSGENGRREADLWISLKLDGTGYVATMQFQGQNQMDSLAVRIDGKRVRLDVRADDQWARRNRSLAGGNTASGKAPNIPLTPPILNLLFEGRDFRGTWRWEGREETVEGRRRT